MAEERRVGKRAPISGVRVTYEGATGSHIEAEVLDLASGGLFIRTDAPLATGKRLALDLTIVGEPGPWSALGRVVWSRPTAEPGRPAGMGVKLIDVDDATLDAIERLVDTREPTAPGVGSATKVPAVKVPAVGAPVVVPPPAPERERTLMGVGAGSEPPPPLTPTPRPAAGVEASKTPAPEPVTEPYHPRAPPAPAAASPDAPAREQSVAIDLIAAKKDIAPVPSPVAASVSSPELVSPLEPPPALAPAPRSMPPAADAGSGSARWVVVVLLLIVAGIAAYVLFDGFLRPMGR
jgi:uncharacterized protein (TIGR02266 family)